MIFDKVRALLADQLEISLSDISMDTHILEDLGADSLDIVELVMRLEEEYNILVTDERANSLYTVRQVVDFIEAHL